MDEYTRFCEFCGKKLPWARFGGFGPCGCLASKQHDAALLAEYEKQQKEEKEKERRERLSPIARRCSHAWKGGSYGSTFCRYCGISFGDYMKYS